MLTPFEATGVKTPRATGDAWLTDLASSSSIALHTYGTSVDGNPMTAATVGSGPVKVAVIGSIHGSEPAGRETAFALLRDLAETTDPALMAYLAGAAWTFMCTANPDSIDAGVRENKNGLDLNRDHVALTQPETQAISAWLQAAPPVLILDLHETSNGAIPDLATAPPRRTGIHPDLRAMSDAVDAAIWNAWQAEGWSPVLYPFDLTTAGTMGNTACLVHKAAGITVETQRSGPALADRIERQMVAALAARAHHEGNAAAYDAAHIAAGGTGPSPDPDPDPDPPTESGLFRTDGTSVALMRTDGSSAVVR